MMTRIEPAMVCMAEPGKGANSDHGYFHPRRGVFAGMTGIWEAGLRFQGPRPVHPKRAFWALRNRRSQESQQ